LRITVHKIKELYTTKFD